MANRRRQILIDPKVQIGLVLRVIIYWFLFLFTLSFMLLVWAAMNGPKRPFAELYGIGFRNLAPAYLGSILILPLLCVDMVRYSNRFVGPVRNLRLGIQAVLDGAPIKVSARRNDFWVETCQNFNEVTAMLDSAHDEQLDQQSHAEEPTAV